MITNNIDGVLREAKKIMGKDLLRFAESMAGAMAEREAPILTGHLRGSIKINAERIPEFVLVQTETGGGGPGYGGYVQLGTSKTAANPYFNRGFEHAKSRVKPGRKG